MQDLSAILMQASARVPAGYFQLPIDGGDPIYRERVYCYELYHQMRCLWPAATEYYLNGEVDKAAHPILRELGADLAKPDLLVHKPGYMSGNHAVMEVKACNAQAAGIQKDLQTLSLFRSRVGYERAIYLLFGYQAHAALERVRSAARELPGLAPIELWVHHEPDQAATYCGDA
jgi:hypothetical protein